MIKKTFADISQDKKVSPKFVTSVIFFKSNKSRQMLLLKNYVTTSVKLNNMASIGQLTQKLKVFMIYFKMICRIRLHLMIKILRLL